MGPRDAYSDDPDIALPPDDDEDPNDPPPF